MTTFWLYHSFAASVAMEIAYGHQVSDREDNDPYLRIADQMNDMVAGLGPQGSNPVDLFPQREVLVLLRLTPSDRLLF